MKKDRKRDEVCDRHGETCMCKKCRARLEAMFHRKGLKTKVKNIRVEYLSEDNDD